MKRMLALLLILCLLLPAAALADGAKGFTLTPIVWDTATIAQCALPSGYEIKFRVDCCNENTCMGYPLRVLLMVGSAEDDVAMAYYCGDQFLDRVSSSTSVLQMRPGELDTETMIYMLNYMDAATYCDLQILTWLTSAGITDYAYWKDEDMSFYQRKLDQRLREFNETIAPGFASYGMKLDWVDITAAQRVFTYMDNGKEYCMCVMAELRAYQYSLNAFGFQATNILWDVPGYYLLTCPKDIYQEVHDTLFMTFTENTVVNDQYLALVDELNYSIRDTVISNMNMTVAASSAYMQAMTALTFSMVESSLSQPTYSSDRFTDYLFDQNDYTLSDGTSVKISTGYDYVYEGSNGVVYYSNSAFAEPGGATRLYPNR
ncbi:MAG: hypothetical protein IJS53_05240 [Clostridia bacterium]|nr:hypothetical protein [Clostridia bacterium]